MEFLINYWYVVLIAFILILLIILCYLVDKEKKDKNIESIDGVDFFKEEDSKTINDLSDGESKSEAISSALNEGALKEDAVVDEDISKDEDLKFEEEFSRFVPKKSLFNDDLKKSIDDIKLEPFEINENKIIKEDIILPEIEITKK